MEYQKRQSLIISTADNLLHYTKSLAPSEIYNALTSLDKNLLSLDVYRDRANILY
jgi:hypothetical protein